MRTPLRRRRCCPRKVLSPPHNRSGTANRCAARPFPEKNLASLRAANCILMPKAGRDLPKHWPIWKNRPPPTLIFIGSMSSGRSRPCGSRLKISSSPVTDISGCLPNFGRRLTFFIGHCNCRPSERFLTGLSEKRQRNLRLKRCLSMLKTRRA